jgi:hypothetical protein
MIHLGQDTGMWDEEDGFFYDVPRLPHGSARRLQIRSLVGLLPLCAATTIERGFREKYPEIDRRFQWFLEARPELVAFIHDPRKPGANGRVLAAILDEPKLRRHSLPFPVSCRPSLCLPCRGSPLARLSRLR